MKDATVTISLEYFDALRKSYEKYDKFSKGFNGYKQWLDNQENEINKPMWDFSRSVQNYNRTNPEHSFTSL